MRWLCMVVLTWAAALTLAGCGSGGSTAGAVAPTPSSQLGTVELVFPPQNVASAQGATAYGVSGADRAGNIVYGPATFPAAPVITLADVPTTVTSLLLVPLRENTALAALEKPVTITPAMVVQLVDPLRTFNSATAVTVTPATASLEPGASQPFAATATFADGARYDVTSLASWSTSDGAVAIVTAQGLATAIVGGVCTLSATIDAVSASASVAVSAAATSVTLASSVNPADSFTPVTFTATVTATAPVSATPSGSVTFLDGATVLSTVPLSGGQASFETSALPAGTHAITAQFGASGQFQASTSAPVSQVMVGSLYAAGASFNSVYKVALDGSHTTYASGFSQPVGLAFDASGNLYVSNVNNNVVNKVAPGGTSVTTFGTAANPRYLAVDASDNVYVGSVNSGAVVKFTPDGSSSLFATLAGPFGLAFAADGTLYVSGPVAASVYTVSAGGTVSPFATSGLITPTGIALDAAGNVYVADNNAGSVTRFIGGVPSTYASGLGSALGLAFDTDGNLYVGTITGIVKVTPQGNVSTFSSELGIVHQLQFR